MRSVKIVSILIVMMGLTLSFQNCGGSDSQFELTGLVDNTSISDGERLYNANCMGCHGSLVNSAKRGRSANQIMNAMNTIPDMANIQLTAAQVQAIANALAL